MVVDRRSAGLRRTPQEGTRLMNLRSWRLNRIVQLGAISIRKLILSNYTPVLKLVLHELMGFHSSAFEYNDDSGLVIYELVSCRVSSRTSLNGMDCNVVEKKLLGMNHPLKPGCL